MTKYDERVVCFQRSRKIGILEVEMKTMRKNTGPAGQRGVGSKLGTDTNENDGQLARKYFGHMSKIHKFLGGII